MSTLNNSIAIGYVNLADTSTITATTSATGYPASNLSLSNLSSSWRSTAGSLTSQSLISDLGVASNVDVVALVGFNGTDDATVIVKTSENSDLSSPEYNPGSGDAWDATTYPSISGYTPRYGRNLIHFTQTTINSRYVGMTLSDAGNSANYLSGRVFWAGPIWQPAISFANGFRKTIEPSGVPGVERPLAALEIDLEALSEAEGRALESICYERLRSGRLLLIPRPAQSSTWLSEALYCTLKGYPKLSAWPQGGGEIRWKVQLTFKECED